MALEDKTDAVTLGTDHCTLRHDVPLGSDSYAPADQGLEKHVRLSKTRFVAHHTVDLVDDDSLCLLNCASRPYQPNFPFNVASRWRLYVDLASSHALHLLYGLPSCETRQHQKAESETRSSMRYRSISVSTFSNNHTNSFSRNKDVVGNLVGRSTGRFATRTEDPP